MYQEKKYISNTIENMKCLKKKNDNIKFYRNKIILKSNKHTLEKEA